MTKVTKSPKKICGICVRFLGQKNKNLVSLCSYVYSPRKTIAESAFLPDFLLFYPLAGISGQKKRR